MDAVAKSLKEDYLTCVICYELFVEPKILPCLHTFCKGCLEMFILKLPGKNDFPCPICREPFSLPSRSVSSLKNNFIFKDMLVKLSESRKAGSKRVCSFCILHSKEVEATHKCITCLDLLCSFCVRHRHLFTRQNAYHEIVLLKDYLTGKCTVKKNFEVICERHNERLRFFCPSCSVPICGECALNDHRRHEYVAFDKAREIIEKDLKITMQNARAKQKKLKQERLLLTSHSQEVLSNETSLLEEVDTHFKEISCRLNKFRQNIEMSIKRKSRAEMEKIEASLKENESNHSNLQESISFCESILLKRSDLEVVFFLDDMKSSLLKYSSQGERKLELFLPSLGININNELSKLFHIKEANDYCKKATTDDTFSRVSNKNDTATSDAKTLENSIRAEQENKASKESAEENAQSITRCVPKCLKSYDMSEIQSDSTSSCVSITWIDKSSFALVDNIKQSAIICKTSSDHGIAKVNTFFVEEIAAITKFSDKLACKTYSREIIIYSYPELVVERTFKGAYTLSSRSSELIWVTRNKIKIFKDCTLTEKKILDEEGVSFEFRQPYHFCCLPNNSFALTDKTVDCLYLLDERGQITARRDFTGQEQLGALSCDKNNRIYMTRYETNNICIFDANGEYLRTISLSCILKKPKVISVMNEEAVLVASKFRVVLLSLK